jgi:hypothetical protein
MPEEESVFVTALFVAHPRPYYVERCHELEVCARDFRKLLSELKGQVLHHNGRKNGGKFERHVYAAVVDWWQSRDSELDKK